MTVIPYVRPNGGKRILPSLYTRLRDLWLRHSGESVDPSDMDPQHVDHCINFLCESHANVVDRSTELLGRMANHFSNQPKIVDLLAQACLEMQKVTEREMYPVIDALHAQLVRATARIDRDIGLPHEEPLVDLLAESIRRTVENKRDIQQQMSRMIRREVHKPVNRVLGDRPDFDYDFDRLWAEAHDK